jgi:hypothetical protein
MIYTLILKPKFRNTLRILAFIILIAFSATLYSCQTVYTEDYTPDKLKTDEDVKYIEAKTKNDSTINLSDYNVTYHENNKDSSKILLLKKPDTKNTTELNLKNIKNIKVEKSKDDVGKTAVFICVLFVVIMGIYIGLNAFGKAMQRLNGIWQGR